MEHYPIAVLISGNGSNLQAIIDEKLKQNFHYEVSVVISNNEDAYGLVRANDAGIPTEVLLAKDYLDRQSYDHALAILIEKYSPKLIVLAGFMRILSEDFVNTYYGKIINIHPSLLPKYRGLQTHQQVLQNKDIDHGVTIHFVSPELDGGPIIVQSKLKVNPDDTVDSLISRIHDIEHQIYPQTIEDFALGKIRLENDKVIQQ